MGHGMADSRKDCGWTNQAAAHCRAQFAEPQVTVHDEVATLLKEIIANPAAKSDPKLYDELKKRKLVKPYEYTVFT